MEPVPPCFQAAFQAWRVQAAAKVQEVRRPLTFPCLSRPQWLVAALTRADAIRLPPSASRRPAARTHVPSVACHAPLAWDLPAQASWVAPPHHPEPGGPQGLRHGRWNGMSPPRSPPSWSDPWRLPLPLRPQPPIAARPGPSPAPPSARLARPQESRPSQLGWSCCWYPPTRHTWVWIPQMFPKSRSSPVFSRAPLIPLWAFQSATWLHKA
mmetsp:Transcript_67561/g.148126  ORF Transcript_67561/g.148126 Transcript_67561/m.148126 type:complete len:211 (+) Transcript_67561:539-1171(+)